MRKKLVAGNWKMHGSRQFVTALIQALIPRLEASGQRHDLVVCPVAVHVPLAATLLEGTALQLGAQNASERAEGAFTGEISVAMLAEYAVRYVIVGHSERRQWFGETDDTVAEKFLAVSRQGMTPILCFGETLEQREQGRTETVVLRQLDAVLSRVTPAQLETAVIAYEPVWAIGTGRTATPAQAQEVHALLRKRLHGQLGPLADRVRIVYGGSVNAANAAELFSQRDIDGGLVGGASLKADDFASICKALD